MAQQIKFAGSWFNGMSSAAGAWADAAMPDVTVALTFEEDPADIAHDLEAFWWSEATKIGEKAPEGVNVEEWRRACRTALQQRIELARKAA